MSDELYRDLSRIAGALANPQRLRALNLLFQSPKAIETLAQLLGESEANTAAHMKVLRAAGLVTSRREGKYVFQEVSSPETLRLFLALRETGEALSPTIRLFNEQDDPASSVTVAELPELTTSPGAWLVDLRPTSEFETGHIPGARSLPMADLESRLGELPKRRRILTYCRGKYCPNARKGVLLLCQAGLRAERLAFGVPEWRAKGYELAMGSER